MKKWAWIAPAVILLDQAVKGWAQGSLRAVALSSFVQDRVLIPGILGLTYAENTGAAFSMLSGQPFAMGLISVLCIGLGWLLLRSYRLGTLSRIGAMLMLGGAVGNLIDRLFRGYVIDMFEFLFVRFAIFNVADAAVTAGAALLFLTMLLCPKDWSKKNGST